MEEQLGGELGAGEEEGEKGEVACRGQGQEVPGVSGIYTVVTEYITYLASSLLMQAKSVIGRITIRMAWKH